MAIRKEICPHCKKIVDMSSHHCSGIDKSRLEYNAKKRRYYQKNKETLKPLMSKRWQKFRLHIIERDNRICQRCFIKYGIINGEELQVHHIKSRINFPDLIYEEENVITTCKTCNLQLGTSDKLDFDWSPPEIEYLL